MNLVLGGIALVLGAAEPTVPEMDYGPAGRLAIQAQGRTAPLDTFARQVVSAVTGRERFQGLDPVGVLLGWRAQRQSWLDADLIEAEYLPLKEALGLPEANRRFSVRRLNASAMLKALAQAGQTKRAHQRAPAPVEAHALEVAERLRLFEEVSTGAAWRLVPPAEADDTWLTPDQNAAAQEAFEAILRAFRAGDGAALREACRRFEATARAVNPSLYPAADRLALECFYNRLQPFFWGGVVSAAAAAAFALALGWRRAWVQAVAVVLASLSFGLQTFGWYARSVLSERYPVSNMYESLVSMAWGLALAVVVIELVWRHRVPGLVGSLLAAVVLGLAQGLGLDASIGPLVPVLRNTIWLAIHVITIMLAYSALALGMGLGHVLLGLGALAPDRTAARERLTGLILWMLDIGIVLLAAGIIFGAVWANEAWGRYWGWDPKETWSLITLLGYLVLVHAMRFSGRRRQVVTAVGSILGFLLVLMTYYGVNYVLATGLHSYGFGSGGGQWLVLLLVGLDLSLVVAGVGWWRRERPGAS